MSNRFPQRPKRKLDPIIYRRRRIFFGSAGLIVILLLWWIVGSVVGAVSNMFNPTPQASLSAPVAQACQPCAPGTLTVIAGIGDETKASFKITSGSETIWDSMHCDRSQDTNAVITLQPAQEISSNPSTWMRVYSSTSGCSTGQKAVAGGGASYHLTATVGGVISNDVQFVLN